jgi:hypothetical protein
MNLRTELIRTAKEKPHLREAILPLVRKAGYMSSDLEWGLKSLSTSNELLEKTIRTFRYTEAWLEKDQDPNDIRMVQRIQKELTDILDNSKKLYWSLAENS